MSVRGQRDVFGQLPLLLGKHPDRPAPVHVVNGFLAAALGQGRVAMAMRHLITDYDTAPPSPPIAASIAEDPTKVVRLRRALGIALNPDRRAFKGRFASIVPLHAAFAFHDPSDERLGSAIWALVAGRAKTILPVLRVLLEPKADEDALTALVQLMAETLPVGNTSAPMDPATLDSPWPIRSGTLSETLATSLATLIEKSVQDAPGRTRSSRVGALSSAVYFAAWLGALRSPVVTLSRAKTWDDVAPMFFYAGMPPGVPNDSAVRLAARSFEAVVGEHREQLASALLRRLSKVKLPKGLPRGQHGRTVLRVALKDVPDQALREFEQLIKATITPETLTERITSAVYPPGWLEAQFRRVGRKLGVAGPDRGFGAPRFLFETPVLGMLVDGTVNVGERLPFDEWLDRLFETFGIVVGVGKRTDPTQLLSVLERPGPLFHALQSNQDAMRRRLLRAGLASEYSDSETEVHRHEEAT